MLSSILCLITQKLNLSVFYDAGVKAGNISFLSHSTPELVSLHRLGSEKLGRGDA